MFHIYHFFLFVFVFLSKTDLRTKPLFKVIFSILSLLFISLFFTSILNGISVIFLSRFLFPMNLSDFSQNLISRRHKAFVRSHLGCTRIHFNFMASSYFAERHRKTSKKSLFTQNILLSFHRSHNE